MRSLPSRADDSPIFPAVRRDRRDSVPDVAGVDNVKKRHRAALRALQQLEAECARHDREIDNARRLRDLVGAALAVVREMGYLIAEPAAAPTFQLETALRDKTGSRQGRPNATQGDDGVVATDTEPINRAIRRSASTLGLSRTEADRLFADLRRLNSAMAPGAEILRVDGWVTVGEARELLPDARSVVAVTHGRVSAELLDVLRLVFGWRDRPVSDEPRTATRRQPGAASRR